LSLTICDQTGDSAKALASVVAKQPQLAVIDCDGDACASIHPVTQIAQQVRHMCIALTAADFTASLLKQAPPGGARASVLKSDTADEIRNALEAALAGKHVFSRRLRERFAVDDQTRDDQLAIATALDALTTREIQVLTCIGHGLSTNAIAEQLGVRPKTVEHHKANVMTKLKIHDRVLLARIAIREGLVPVQDEVCAASAAHAVRTADGADMANMAALSRPLARRPNAVLRVKQ